MTREELAVHVCSPLLASPACVTRSRVGKSTPSLDANDDTVTALRGELAHQLSAVILLDVSALSSLLGRPFVVSWLVAMRGDQGLCSGVLLLTTRTGLEGPKVLGVMRMRKADSLGQVKRFQ